MRLGAGDSKRSLYNDKLPEPTEAENAASRAAGLFLREEEPTEAEATTEQAVSSPTRVLTHHIREEGPQ